MKEKKVAFCCESIYQLFNAIILKMKLEKAYQCDIVMNMVTQWKQDLVERLIQSNVFDNVYVLNHKEADVELWNMDLENRREVVTNPQIYFRNMQEVTWNYDVLYIPIDHIMWKLAYYTEINNNIDVEINMYDEGIRSYFMDIPDGDKKPYLVDLYAEKEFNKAVKSFYLYQPECYVIDEFDYEIKQMPILSDEDKDIKDIIFGIFGNDNLPNQKYIYLEDNFYTDGTITNDFQLFEKVVEIVGKDNIISKCHPRDKKDRFLEKGYNTYQKTSTPWEVQLMTGSIESKVLVSVISTSILTPFIIYNSDIHVISLERMLIGKAKIREEKKYGDFMNAIVKKINCNGIRYHKPRDLDELKEVIRFIEMEYKTKDRG